MPAAKDGAWANIAKYRGRDLARSRNAIVIAGDSLAAGFPAELQRAEFGEAFVNVGLNGDRTENLLWRLSSYDLDHAAPRAVILIIGTNNLLTADTPEQIAGGILAAVKAIRAQTKARIIVSEILPRGPDLNDKAREIGRINRLLDAAAAANGYSLLRVNEAMRRASATRGRAVIYSGPVHLREEGYRVLSRALRPLLPAGPPRR